MRIDFVEIRNFRRLAAIKIDFSEKTTLFVGANNSGKTSAIVALRYFLIQHNAFSVYDIPLALWARINQWGEAFEKDENQEFLDKWRELFPSLDVWLKVAEDEIHHVAHLLPTLDWTPDQGIGIRLQLEPKRPDEFLKTFLESRKAARHALSAGQQAETSSNLPSSQAGLGKGQIAGNGRIFSLWPQDLIDFLKKPTHMATFFTVNAYLLDPSKKKAPNNGVAQPQILPDSAEPLEDSPFKGLIKINEIPAHRDFSDYQGTGGDAEEPAQDGRGRKQMLTAQLRAYYGKHLDPSKAPESSDIQALRAIHEAQVAFDERLRNCFGAAIGELEGLGYPGVANPRLVISTFLRPVEGLKHQSAVQYDVAGAHGQSAAYCRLPEQCNGLGYQNLISMVFRLISFRDDWMRVGKAARTLEDTGARQVSPPPLHLVLLEEPEAHLHVQVQQVFIRKAYEVLRNHPDLQDKSQLSTQLVVSTHSSHVAHEVEYAHMRYFRRHPARNSGETPTSTVVNLSEVFGDPDDTARFVSRYLKATHADLFFADGAILVEGAAERILIPHFIRYRYKSLHTCYLTLLEVGGSHAHRLAPLVKHLGLNTLVITDIDAVQNTKNRPKARPERGKGQLTGSNVLKEWHPQKKSLDDLLDLSEGEKEKAGDDFFSIRVAYQSPVHVAFGEKPPVEVFPRTFEDALILENIDFFRKAEGDGLIKKCRKAIEKRKSIPALHRDLLKELESATKAQFALDILYSEDVASLQVPKYIQDGLSWLEKRLLERRQEVVARECDATEGSETGAK